MTAICCDLLIDTCCNGETGFCQGCADDEIAWQEEQAYGPKPPVVPSKVALTQGEGE